MAEAIWFRSRISFCAAAASFHSAGSSARLFSSARRASATSQSKMPPQQRDGLLDLFVQGVGFGGHDFNISNPRAGSIQATHAGINPAVHGSRRRG
jgi:hypothetical protein